MSEIELVPLFSTPLYNNRNINCDNKYIINEANKLEWEKIGYSDESDNNNIYITTSLNVLDNEAFIDIKNIILDNVSIYLTDVFNCKQSFSICKSWFLKAFGSGRNTMSDWHFHRNCSVSGVYYPHAPEGSGEIQFTNSFIQRSDIIPSDDFNIYNSSLWNIKPSEGQLLLFPSWTLHRVDKSVFNSERYSLAFDIRLNNE